MYRFILIIAITSLFAQELEIEGDLKVSGNIQAGPIDSLQLVISNLQSQLEGIHSIVNNYTGFTAVEVYESPGVFSWTPPENVDFVLIEAWGAGGGPHGVDYDCGSFDEGWISNGGGAGAYVRSYVNVSADSSYTIDIGTGGYVDGEDCSCCGNIYTNNQNCGGIGVQGGSTKFNDIVIAQGGKGESQSNYQNSSVGQIIIYGNENGTSGPTNSDKMIGAKSHLAYNWGNGGNGGDGRGCCPCPGQGGAGRLVIHY